MFSSFNDMPAKITPKNYHGESHAYFLFRLLEMIAVVLAFQRVLVGITVLLSFLSGVVSYGNGFGLGVLNVTVSEPTI